jgi:hypothetical protein
VHPTRTNDGPTTTKRRSLRETLAAMLLPKRRTGQGPLHEHLEEEQQRRCGPLKAVLILDGR